MAFTVIQILAIIFALFALSRAILRVKDNEISGKEFAFWATVWIAVIIIAIFPSFAISFAELFGIDRGVDFLVYVGMLALFYLVFRLYVKIDKISQEITKITRVVAIKSGKKRKRGKK